MKKIPLRNNRKKIVAYAKVDDEDFERVMQYNSWAQLVKPYTTYAKTWIHNSKNGKDESLFMHRLIMNPPKGMDVHHIDHDGLNNRKSNLVVCTRRENMRHLKLERDLPTGVYRSQNNSKNAYRAGATIGGIWTALGYYKTIAAAERAYLRACEEDDSE